MLLNRRTWPVHRAWALGVSALAVLAIAGYLTYAVSTNAAYWPGGSSPVGLLFGIAGGAIIVFEILLWPRRWPRVRAWRIGRTQVWLRAHIWLGLLSVPLVILHHGLAWEWGGWLTVLLMVFFWCVIASGVFGLYLQQVLPSHMLHSLPAESIVSQIPNLSRQMVAEVERSLWDVGDDVTGRGDEAAEDEEELAPQFATYTVRSVGHIEGKVLETNVVKSKQLAQRDATRLRDAFTSTIRPFLLGDRKQGAPVRTATSAATYFATLRSNLSEDATPQVQLLVDHCNTRRQFNKQIRVHRLLHGWMCIHLPLSLALLVFLLAHIVAALRYSGLWPV